MLTPPDIQPQHAVAQQPPAAVALWLVTLANSNGGLLTGLDTNTLAAALSQTMPPVPHTSGPDGQVYVPRSAALHALADGSVFVEGYADGQRVPQRLDRTGIQQLATLKQVGDFEAEPVPETSPAAFDPDLLARFFGYVSPEPAALAQVGALDATSELPTVAGLLLLARQPQIWLPHSAVRLIHYPTSRQAAQRNADPSGVVHIVERGPLPTLLDQTRQRLRVSLNLPDDDALSPAQAAYWKALQVVVVNALAHREYRVQAPVVISLYTDAVTVSSPGGPVLPGAGDDLARCGLWRNPQLVRGLARLGYTAQRGGSLLASRRGLLHNNLPAPHIEASPHQLAVTLYNKMGNKTRGQTGDSATDTSPLTAKQTRILQYIQECGSITEWELKALFPSLSSQQCQAELAGLLAGHYVRKVAMGPPGRSGQERATSYILNTQSPDDNVE